MTAIPIILDTDLGDDIDDALALALALASPEIELRGVTTVFIDASKRAALTRHLLQLFGTSTRVVAGCSRPLLQPIQTGSVLGHQFQIEHDATWNDQTHAVDFLIESVMASDEKITLVPIGPLTNIALALAREPKLATRCDIVLMGGDLSCGCSEWNILCDPEAAQMVLNSGAKISLVGLDVTTQCKLNTNQIESLTRLTHSSTRWAQAYAQIIDLWQREASYDLTLHDPLALMSVFLPDVITWEERRLEIGLCGDNRGKTLTVDGDPNARVAVGVDAPRVVEMFIERVSQILSNSLVVKG